MLDFIQGFLKGPKVEAAELPSPQPPKIKGRSGQATSYPTYLTSTNQPRDSSLRRNDRRLAVTDTSRLSRNRDTLSFMRDLVHSSPDLSAALNAHLRLAITSNYHAVARNLDGTFNREATNLVQQLLVRFDILPSEYDGFAGVGSMRSNSEALSKEIMLYGACAAELVLGKDRLPRKIQPISSTTVEFRPDGDRLVPVQILGGDEVNLDIPTFFYVGLDADLLDAYPSPPLESAIKPALFAEEFQAQLQRVTNRAVHPRQQVKIDMEKFMRFAPPEALHDGEAQTQFQNNFVTNIEETINGLSPQDALVYFDVMEISRETNGNISLSREWEVLKEYTEARVASGAHTLPAVLGHGAGSSNIASTETLLFIKSVAGSVQLKLNEIYSRMLTLAVRLFGVDAYVEFWYDPIDLRPESELAAFRQTKQSYMLELLSLGFLEDEEFAIEVIGKLPPAGMQRLSGTFFKSAMADGTLGTGMTPSNDGSTLNQNLKSDQPTQGRGANNRRNPVKQ
jgi:hypothetical protein